MIFVSLDFALVQDSQGLEICICQSLILALGADKKSLGPI